jgi:hypothetical protein
MRRFLVAAVAALGLIGVVRAADIPTLKGPMPLGITVDIFNNLIIQINAAVHTLQAQIASAVSGAMNLTASNATLPGARNNLGALPALNAKLDYGATGNNSTNDGPALATALAACGPTMPLYLPPGRYKTQQQLTVPAGCIFFGDITLNYGAPFAAPSPEPGTVIIADNTAGAFTATLTAVVTMSDNTSITGIGVKGTAVSGQADAIAIAGSWIILDNVNAYQGYRNIYCNKLGGGVYQGVQVVNSISGFAIAEGVFMGAGCSDSTISNSYINANGTSGVQVKTSGLRIVNTRIEWNTTNGVLAFDAIFLNIAASQIVDNYQSGIYLNSSDNAITDVSIVGSTFNDNGRAQTSFQDCHVTITGTVTGLVMAANNFKTGTGGPASAVVPNYDYCANGTPILTTSDIRDRPPAMALGIYKDATTQTAVQTAQIISPTFGGTGVNNGSFTATLGGNLVTGGALTQSGAFATTITTTATTNSTLPAGTHSLAPLDSPTFTTPALGAATATTLAIGGATLGANALAVTGIIANSGNFLGNSGASQLLGNTGGSTPAGASLSYAFASNFTNASRELSYFNLDTAAALSHCFYQRLSGSVPDLLCLTPAGHILVSATTAPALTSCGTGSPTNTGGTDQAGTVTLGTNATGCVITFNAAYTGTPHCVVTWQNTPLASQSYVVSNTAITLTQTSTSGNKVNYSCKGLTAG